MRGKAGNRSDQLFWLGRLGEIVLEACAQGPPPFLFARVPGQGNRRDLLALCLCEPPRLGNQRVAVLVRELLALAISGSVTVKVAPRCGPSLCASTVPPCNSVRW